MHLVHTVKTASPHIPGEQASGQGAEQVPGLILQERKPSMFSPFLLFRMTAVEHPNKVFVLFCHWIASALAQ